MPGKYAAVDFNKCLPEECEPVRGECHATASCARRLLEQEDAFDSPMLTSVALCVGCGDCAKVCPLNAISIEYS